MLLGVARSAEAQELRRSQGGEHLHQIQELIGKEASVYCCRGGPALAGVDLVAAKILRARQYRFKNDAVYQESRAREMGISGRAARALAKKSDFGREVQGGPWVAHEFETLRTLHGVGADVPYPYTHSGEVILMEFFGDEEAAASQLNRVRLDPAEAPALFQRLINNIELWLSCNRVHGDLSPHNILYHEGEVRVIDFPQATDPRFNHSAQMLLQRDITNVCRYFAASGVETDAVAIADELWRRFIYGDL